MNVILYGAGLYGKKALTAIEKYPDIEVIGFADSYKSGSVYDYPILDLYDSKTLYKNIPIILTMSIVVHAVEVFHSLKALGYEKLYYYLHKDKCFSGDFFTDECFLMENITEKTLPSAEMHLVDHCNLNCKGCAHFSALFEKELPNLNERLQDVKKIADIFDNILFFDMMGGEPLLNPQIKDYIIEIRRILPRTELRLITNGLLIPRLACDILECIANNHVTVGVSEYKPTQKIINDIRSRLEGYRIDYFVKAYEQKQKFIKPLSLTPDSIYPHKCISQGCVNIWNGKIAKCPTLMYINKLNQKFETRFPEDGIIDLQSTLDGKELLEQLGQSVPLCAYCVECEIEWEICGSDIDLSCFAIDK